MTRHTLVRIILFGVLTLFLFQTGGCLLAGEPYPALMAPIFPGEPTEDGIITQENFQVAVLTADGSTKGLSGAELFEEIQVQPIFVARNVFGVGTRPDDPSTRSWLRGRLESLLPNDEPRAVEFRWSVVTYSAKRDPEFRGREHSGTTRIDL